MELSRKLSTAILPMTYLAKWKNTALRQTAVEPLASDEAERSLRIGDYVSLFSVEHNGYLSTDGFSDEVCHLKKVPQAHAALAPNNFENCVFEIVPRFKYDMQVNLDDMLSTYGRERESIGLYDDGDPQIEKQLKVLVQQEELERKENLAEYHRTANKNVAYGQIVQLRHVKSKCFLSLTVKEAAELEKDALRIVLEKEGSEGSWFIITPRLKMRSEGEPVNLGDQVAFISKKFNIFLHCSIKSSRSEINGSSAFTPWRIIPFAPFSPASHTSQFLKAGDVVRIFHKEVEGFLTDEYQLESYDDKKDPSAPHDRNSTSSASSGTPAASGSLATRGTDKLFFESHSTVTSTANDGGSRHGSGSSSHSHSTLSAQQHSATAQKNTTSTSNSNSNSLWLVEMENTMRGGIVTFDKCVRFKHIPSGKYLASELPPTPSITSASTGHLGAAGGLPDISALPHSSSPSALGTSSLDYTSLSSASAPTSTLGLSNGRRMESSQPATIQDLGNSHRTVSGTFSLSYASTTLQRASGPSSLGSLSNPSSSRSLSRVPARSDLKLKVFMTDDPNSPNALFTLHSANNPNQSEGNVELDSFVRIRHKETKCWLHAVVGEKPEQKRRKIHHPHSGHTTNLFPPTNTDGSASPGNVTQAKVAIEVDSRSLFFDSDVYVLAPVPSHDVRTLYQVLGEIHYLQSYLGTLTRAAQHGFYQNDRRMSKWLANDTRKLSRVLSALIDGCKGSSGSRLNSSAYIGSGSASSSSTASPAYYNSLLDLTSGDSNHHSEQASSGPSKTPATALSTSTSLPNPKMQNLLREQNIADVLVAILARMFKGKSSSESEDFKSQPENMALVNICKLSYSLLRHLVIDNHSNRIYLSKYVPFMLGQIGLSIKAAATLMELFKDNFDLATGITESTIQRCFLDKLIDRPVLRYVQFLGVLCECSGMPLSKNQDFIAKCILVDHSDSFLPIREHHDEELDEAASSGVIELQLRVPTKNHYKWIGLDKFVEIFAPESKAVAYVVESVHLVSQVCLGGNVNSCSLLSKHISVNMLNRCLENEKLPAALRAAFCRLLLNLILADKEIAKPVSFIKYTRLWSDINKEYLKQQSTSGDLASPSTGPQSAPTRLQSTGPSTPTLLRKGGIRSTPKKTGFTFSTNDFNRTKQFIMTYLKNVSAHVSGPGSDRNVLIAAVVDMAKHIFSFGRFSHSDILSLIPLLLTLAHGSAFPPSYIYFDPIEKVHININPFVRSPLTRYILDFKHSIGQILDMACDYRTDCRLTQLLVLYKKKIENNNGAVPQVPGKGGNSPDLAGGIFAHIGAALRNLVDSESMLDSIEKVLEFLNLGTETYLPIVTDFLLHNQPSLATLGSRLLVRHFSQKKELLDALKAVQILVDPQLVVIYQSVSKTLNNLRRFIASSSSNEEDDGSVKNQDEAVEIMESLIALISKPKEDSYELGDSSFSSATSSQSSHPAPAQKYDPQRIHEHQRLMLNLRVDVTVLELMQVEAAKLNFFLMTLCYDFLQCLCSGPFPDGQANLFRSMDLFLEHIDDEELSLQAATTIQAIFHGNRLISSQVTEIQLRKILNQVAQKKLPIYLDILTTLAQIDGKPFRRNQNLIAKLLMEKQNDVVVLYNDTASLRRRNEMIKNLQFLDPNSELVYHVKLIDLFVIACKGKVYEAEVKSQSLFSLDDILFQVSDRANWPRIKSGFIALLEEAYLVTERSLKNIAQAPQIWELMEVFIRDINAHVNHEFSITTTKTITPTKESSSVTSSPTSTSSQPPTITSKITPRRGMLQVDPNLLQQHSPQSASDATPPASPSSAPIDQKTSSNTTGPRTLQRRAEIRQLTTTSGELKDSGLSLSGRKRALSKGNSSPQLQTNLSVSTEDLTPSSSLSISTEPTSALETPATSTQEAVIPETSKISTTAVANERSLLRRGGANRSLRPNSSVTETSEAPSSTPVDASTSTETKLASETLSTFIASTDPSIQLSAPPSQETASSTSIARPALRRPDAFNNRAGGVQSLQKKSVSWRGTPTASIDSINSEYRDLGEPSKLDELEVESSSSSSSSSSSDSDDSSSTSSSSSSSTDSDDEAEERRSRERLAAARARDAALNAEAEKEEEDALKAAEEAKIEEAQNSAIRKRHFFEHERSFIFDAVLPFLARYCAGQWASKRLDASQIEKLNEVLDAVHTLLEIQNLTYAEKLTVFACEEAMGTRGITGIENKLDIAKFLSDFKRLEVDPSTITPIKKEASGGPHIKKRSLNTAVVPPLLSTVSAAAVVSGGASNLLLGPGSRQSLVRRPRSYRDLSASSTSSEAVTQGLIVFHKDCETHMKSNQELIGLASLLKKDIDDSLQALDFNSKEGQLTSAYQSITRKLAIQLGDPEYALHNENETNMVVDILRSLRLILLEPRIEAEKTEAEEKGEVLDLEESEVEKSFPGAIAMFQTLRSKNHSADNVVDEDEDDDKKRSNNKEVSQARDSSSKEVGNSDATSLLSKISSVLAPLSSIKAALSKDLSEEEDKSGIYDELLTEAQNKLNVFGFAPVIAQLITSPVETVAQEAIRCAIALLWGGNKHIQDAILKVFETPASGGMFFHEMRHRLRKGMTEVEERKEFVRKQQQHLEEGQQQQPDDAKEEHEDASTAGTGSAASTPRARSDSTTSRGSSSSFDSDHDLHHRLESDNEDEDLKSQVDSGTINSTYAAKAAKDMRAMEELLRLLQLLCEGHNHVLQDYLRTQPRNIQSYDLVTETALYLEALERNIDDESVSTAVQTFTTLTEYCQGPCVDNQLALIRTKICESVNFIMHEGNVRCGKLKTLELHSACLTTLLSLLEGVSTNPLIPRHLLTSLDLTLMEHNIKEIISSVTLQLQKDGTSNKRGWRPQSKAIFDTSDLPEEVQAQIECGYLYFFLLRTLNDYDEHGKILSIIRAFPPENFFSAAVGSLEIVRSGQLERVYFRIPAVCSHLTNKSKEDLIRNVKRTNQQEKLEDMFFRSEHLLNEMEHRETLSKSSSFSWMSSNEEMFKNLSFIFSLLINFLIIGYYHAVPTSAAEIPPLQEDAGADAAAVTGGDPSIANTASSNSSFTISPWVVLLMFILAVVQLGFSGITLFIYAVSHIPPRLRKHWNSTLAQDWLPSFHRLPESYHHLATSLFIVLSDTYFMYYLCYVLFGLLGIWNLPNAPYFFAFHLLDIVVRSELLKYVIKSVTANGKAIMLTACLALVVVYIYSIFGFLFFRAKFNSDGGCENMLMCLVTSINLGLRSGGGIGDIMEPPVWSDPDTTWRILYDSTFFFLVIVIMLNIIFGIIIDTFGELRTQNNEIEEDIKNKCFICGHERETFDRNAEGFEHHIESDHAVFHYIYFFMYLKRKERTEYTGPEQFVAERLSMKDWTFMPVLRAICLGAEHEEEDENSAKILDGVTQLTKATSTQLEQLRKGIAKKQTEMEEKMAGDSLRNEEASFDFSTRMGAYDARLQNVEAKMDRLLALLDHQMQGQQELLKASQAVLALKDSLSSSRAPTSPITASSSINPESSESSDLSSNTTTATDPSPLRSSPSLNLERSLRGGLGGLRTSSSLSKTNSDDTTPSSSSSTGVLNMSSGALSNSSGSRSLRQPSRTLRGSSPQQDASLPQ